MSKSAADEWQLRLKLAPGVYRFRYYAGDARQMTYYGPAQITGGVVDAMDTKLELLPRKQPLSANLASSEWQSGVVRRCS